MTGASSSGGPAAAAGRGPEIKIVLGNPGPAELAAVTVVILARARAPGAIPHVMDAPRRARWAGGETGYRPPGSWASAGRAHTTGRPYAGWASG